jgi:hypothetical protein
VVHSPPLISPARFSSPIAIPAMIVRNAMRRSNRPMIFPRSPAAASRNGASRRFCQRAAAGATPRASSLNCSRYSEA